MRDDLDDPTSRVGDSRHVYPLLIAFHDELGCETLGLLVILHDVPPARYRVEDFGHADSCQSTRFAIPHRGIGVPANLRRARQPGKMPQATGALPREGLEKTPSHYIADPEPETSSVEHLDCRRERPRH
jgi:hypothetical protein